MSLECCNEFKKAVASDILDIPIVIGFVENVDVLA
jgi:hypothetical protein